MTPAQEALRDAFLAELWPTCREVPREIREIEAVKARMAAEERERGAA